MNVRAKSLLATGLGALAGVVWIPQLLAREAPREPAPESSAERVAAATEGGETNAPRARTSESSTAEGSFSELEAALGLLLERRRDPVLERLLPEAEEALSAAPEDALTFEGPSDDEAWLARFAAENPLSGLIHGTDKSAALLGHRVVRPGERLEGGRVGVLAIGPGWIELEHGSARLVLELPAFRARGGGLHEPSAAFPSAPRPAQKAGAAPERGAQE
jgi:hypothetical protein